MKIESADRIYKHYSALPYWVKAEGVSAGSAFRLVHQIANILEQLDLSATSIPLASLRTQTGLSRLESQGVLVEQLARFSLTASVGNLLGLVNGLECVVTGLRSNPIPPAVLDGLRIPKSRVLFSGAVLNVAWMKWFRAIRREFKNLDNGLQRFESEPCKVRRLVFTAYLLCASLHLALSILAYASDLRSDNAKHRKRKDSLKVKTR